MVAYFTFDDFGDNLEEIEMKLPRKKILYLDVAEIDAYASKKTDTDDAATTTVSPTATEPIKKKLVLSSENTAGEAPSVAGSPDASSGEKQKKGKGKKK